VSCRRIPQRPSSASGRWPDGLFTSITFFTSLCAVRGFAGDDYEQAVIEDTARQALLRWVGRISCHKVVAELE
jgi:hypothetical protein